jgi:hypothetical protein
VRAPKLTVTLIIAPHSLLPALLGLPALHSRQRVLCCGKAHRIIHGGAVPIGQRDAKACTFSVFSGSNAQSMIREHKANKTGGVAKLQRVWSLGRLICCRGLPSETEFASNWPVRCLKWKECK